MIPLCCRRWVCMKTDVGRPFYFQTARKTIVHHFFFRSRFPLTRTLHPFIPLIFSNMTDTMLASTTLTVNCATPVAKGNITLKAANYNPSYTSFWTCTITNQTPQLEISLVWTCGSGYQPYLQPYNIQSLRIISRDGEIVYSAPINGVVLSTPLTGMACICSNKSAPLNLS